MGWLICHTSMFPGLPQLLQLTVYNSSNLAIGNGTDINDDILPFVPMDIMYAAIATSCNQIHWSMKDKMWFVTLVH